MKETSISANGYYALGCVPTSGTKHYPPLSTILHYRYTYLSLDPPHFADENAKSQEGYIMCPGSKITFRYNSAGPAPLMATFGTLFPPPLSLNVLRCLLLNQNDFDLLKNKS